MNKTYTLLENQKKRFVATQQQFYPKRQYSPLKSQKNIDATGLRTQLSLSKNYGITSTNWCIHDLNTNQMIGLRQQQQREVASLTKIMTVIIGLELIQSYKLQKNIMIRVSSNATALNGTTASLKEGKYIKLYDLFYGAMLPSGNDAAYMIAQVFGLLLFYQTLKPQTKDYSEIESIDLTCYQSTTIFVNRFIKQMNKKANDLQLSKTVFANPHGLANIMNVSSAMDIITLSKYAFINQNFKQIANTKYYSTCLYEQDMNTKFGVRKWENTNKLLDQGWEGIKTGQTIPAGACLSSYRDGIYIVILNSSTKETRFEDTLGLWQWYHNQHLKQ